MPVVSIPATIPAIARRTAGARLHCGLLAALLAALAGSAQANGGFQLTWDNDSWLHNGSDRWYTNGIRLSWARNCEANDQQVSDTLRKAMGPLSVVAPDEPANGDAGCNDTRTPRMTYTLGQTMYTPRRIDIARPQPDDRPWAGFLYLAASLLKASGDTTTATEVKLGVTGPAAQADGAQRLVHRLTHSTTPQGWPQQLRGRLGVQVSRAYIKRPKALNGHWLGVQGHAGLSLGSLRNYGSVGAALLAGDLRGQESPVLIGNEGDFVVQDFSDLPQFAKPYAFLAGSLTAVASNWFLDGETPYGRSRIERRDSYRSWQWGVSLPLSLLTCRHGYSRVVYAQTARTAEFDSPRVSAREALQRWATVALVVDY